MLSQVGAGVWCAPLVPGLNRVLSVRISVLAYGRTLFSLFLKPEINRPNLPCVPFKKKKNYSTKSNWLLWEKKSREFIVFYVKPLKNPDTLSSQTRKNADMTTPGKTNLLNGPETFISRSVKVTSLSTKINKMAVLPANVTRRRITLLQLNQATGYIIIVPLRWYDRALYSGLHSGITLTYFSEHSQIKLQFQPTLTISDHDRYYNQAKRGWSIINVVPHVRKTDLF